MAGWGAPAPPWARQPAVRRAIRQQHYAFTPYQPPPLPSGSYDPSLDAARRAASRGLGDTVQSTETGNARDITDYGASRDQILQDQARGNQNLDRQVQMLQQGYQRLQNRQGQQFNASGLAGGAALQAAAKRTANQATDMQPIDTARTRLQQDTGTQLGRLALDMAPPSADQPLGGRRFQDRATALGIAQREDVNFGIDTKAQQAYQAGGANYSPPQRGEAGGIPANEHIGAGGQHYQTHVSGNSVVRVDPQGRVIYRRKRH